jgi:hypothetical protein
LPVDQFLRFSTPRVRPPAARRRAGAAILDWLRTNVDYDHGVSTGTTSAADTFVDRAGVCRDFLIGMTAVCRAPRAFRPAPLPPMLALDHFDFNAVFGVPRWWLVAR